MKTLINKANPQIRITAPEIESYREFYTLSETGGDFHYLFKMEDWTLVEEEPTCKTCGFYENNCPFIRGKFIVYPNRVCKDYIYSAMKEQKLNPSNSVGLEQKPAQWGKDDEDMYARIVRRYTDYEGVIMRTKEESVAAKILDAMAQEEIWLKSLRPQPKKEWSVEKEPVDLEKEIRKHTDLFHADIEYPLRLTAIKFYELGKKGGSK